MRIAVISDVHGNLEALNTVLEDIKKRGIDKIYCLGDIIAKGTHQQECVDLVRTNCEVVIKGNCDEYYSRPSIPSDKPETEKMRFNWNTNKINDDSKAYLQGLPFCHEFYLSGRLVRLIHATPTSIDGFVGGVDTLENLYSLFLPSENTISESKADILIYGHIHNPFVQKIYNRYIINAGSVGNPIDVFRNPDKDADSRFTTVANYLILNGNLDSKDVNDDFSYELVSLSYDIEKELDANTDNIEFEGYATELREGKYRDMAKVYKSFELRGINKDSI
nr:metallophosphoesterase family protein [Bacilli bacterium]